ncbi:helix-turn-helix protein [Fontibacillus phaseoli]|uniref:Helix-turn-helix protein n=1 Tax=Fontibacillus phaseoli TaxID=1416533 RepID=A0A369B865_9BACL|nr:helix-turn-helix transcriptional regulator [Fontibacillus phaseoli]RCX17713.1 helix-turn-helix protein [Fontibacillus phaseoli]
MLEHLSELRKNRKWSLQETADQLGIAKSTYAGYETGYREPSLQSLLQMADLFETTVDYILGRCDEERCVTELTGLLTRPDPGITIDGEPLATDDMIEFVAFVRMKRLLKTQGHDGQ